MANYDSPFSGAQVDEAIDKILNGLLDATSLSFTYSGVAGAVERVLQGRFEEYISLDDFFPPVYPNDISSALQAAVTAAQDKKVRLLIRGKRRVSSKILIGSNLQIEGDFSSELEYDYEQVITDRFAPGFAAEKHNSLFTAIADSSAYENLMISDIKLTYIGTFNIPQIPYYVHGGGQLSAIHLEWFHKVRLTNVTCSGWNFGGVNFDTPLDTVGLDARFSSNVTILDCDFSSNRKQGMQVRHVQNIDILITKGNLNGFNDPAYIGSSGYGITGQQNFGNYVHNIRIIGGEYSNNLRKGIDFHGGTNIVVSGLTSMWNIKSDIDINTQQAGVTNVSDVIIGGVADVEPSQDMDITRLFMGFTSQSDAQLQTELFKYNVSNIQILELNRQDVVMTNGRTLTGIDIRTAANNMQINISNITINSRGYISQGIQLRNSGSGQANFNNNTLSMSNVSINVAELSGGEASGISKFVTIAGMETVNLTNIDMKGRQGLGASSTNSSGNLGGIEVTDNTESHFKSLTASNVTITGQGFDGTSYVDYVQAVNVPFNNSDLKYNIVNNVKNGLADNFFGLGGTDFNTVTERGLSAVPSTSYGSESGNVRSNPYINEYRIRTSGSSELALLTLDVPNKEIFFIVEVLVTSSRAPLSTVNGSRVAKQMFAIGRSTGNATTIDQLVGAGEFELTTTSAGGSNAAMTIGLNADIASGGVGGTQVIEIRGTISAFGGNTAIGVIDAKIVGSSIR